MLQIRQASETDIGEISRFTDYWLSGRGKRNDAPGATNDCFITASQHRRYVVKYQTFVMYEGSRLVGWAVLHTSGQLIHLLIAGDCRGRGLGSRLLEHVNPPQVRSKSNQQSGNPRRFYEQHGYSFVEAQEPACHCGFSKRDTGRARTIEIFRKN